MQLPTLYKCLLLTLLLALTPNTAHARPPSDADSAYWANWSFAANIDCHDGTETLSMITNLPAVKGAGWVIPIPARPEQIQLEWVPRLPIYGGRTPASMLHGQLAIVLLASRATQLYPIPFDFVFTTGGAYSAEGLPDSNHYPGLACDLVFPDALPSLRQHVSDSGIALEPGDIDHLSKFLDGRHSFIFIRVESVSRYTNALLAAGLTGESVKTGSFFSVLGSPCLQIRFPYANPILPMRAISNHGSIDEIQNVSILGYVDFAPSTLQRVDSIHLRYYRGTRRDVATHRSAVPYTRLHYGGPTVQLNFFQITGPDFNQIDHGYQYIDSPFVFWATLITWTALCSYLCGGIAGLVSAKRWRGCASLGLWNLTTLLGLRIRMGRLGIDEKPRSTYLWTFTLCFLAINILAPYLLTQLLGTYSPGW